MTQLSRAVNTLPELIDLVNGLSAANETPKVFDGQYGAQLYRMGSVSGTYAVDWNLSNEFFGTVTDTITFTFANALDGFRYILTLKQGGAGSYSYSFPTNVVWPDGVEPTSGSVAGAYDLFTFQYLADEDTFIGAYSRNLT